MFTKVELTYLNKLKRFNGLSEEEIEEELINLISSENLFKGLNKELQKTRKELSKIKMANENLKEELTRKNKEIFNLTIYFKSTSNMSKDDVNEQKKLLTLMNKICVVNLMKKNND